MVQVAAVGKSTARKVQAHTNSEPKPKIKYINKKMLEKCCQKIEQIMTR